MIRIVNSLYSTWQSICVIHILHALYIICSIWACYAVGPLIIVRQKTKRQKTFFPKNVFWAWKAEVIGGQKTEIHRKTKCLFVFKDRNREWKTFLHNGASLIVIHTDEQHRAQWFIVSSIGRSLPLLWQAWRPMVSRPRRLQSLEKHVGETTYDTPHSCQQWKHWHLHQWNRIPDRVYSGRNHNYWSDCERWRVCVDLNLHTYIQ